MPAVNIDGFFHLAKRLCLTCSAVEGRSLPCPACQDWRATGDRQATTRQRRRSPTSCALWLWTGARGARINAVAPAHLGVDRPTAPAMTQQDG
jgi:hypothetical protein